MHEFVRRLAIALTIVGAWNWGLYGVWGVDLIEKFCGRGGFAKFLYILVALSGFFVLYMNLARKGWLPGG